MCVNYLNKIQADYIFIMIVVKWENTINVISKKNKDRTRMRCHGLFT